MSLRNLVLLFLVAHLHALARIHITDADRLCPRDVNRQR